MNKYTGNILRRKMITIINRNQFSLLVVQEMKGIKLPDILGNKYTLSPLVNYINSSWEMETAPSHGVRTVHIN